MAFNDRLRISWAEYKGGLKAYLAITALFIIIPDLLRYLVAIPLGLEYYASGADIFKLGSTIFEPKFLIPNMTMLILNFVSRTFAVASIIYFCVYRRKSFIEALYGGRRYLLKCIWLSQVLGFFVSGLLFLLVIPGIIFSIYWSFSYFVLIGTNKGVIGSLKESREIIKGNWWKVFGYLICFALFVSILALPFKIIGDVVIKTFIGLSTPITKDILSKIFEWIPQLITIPLIVLFLKNLFLELRREKLMIYQSIPTKNWH